MKSGWGVKIEGSKERPCELDKEEEEKKALQESTQGLEWIFVKQNECVTMLKKKHNSQTLKQRRTLRSDKAWGSQTADMKNGNIGINISQDDF